MMARLFPLLLTLLLLSCQESQETKISRLVKEWEGKDILYPKECSIAIRLQNGTVKFGMNWSIKQNIFEHNKKIKLY